LSGDWTPNGAQIPAGGVIDQWYCFDVPADAVFKEGNAFARFRLSRNNSLEAVGPATMPYPYGEVEDPAMNDIGIEFIWAGPDGDVNTTGDNRTYTTVTGPASGQSDGEYYICGLIPGTYKLIIQTPDRMTPTRWDVGDDVFDSDGVVTGMDLSMIMEEFTIADVTALPTNESAPGDSGAAGVGSFPDNQVDETHDYGFARLDYGD